MARITVYLRNGREFDFETASLAPGDIKLTKDGKILSINAGKKDNGISLMYVDCAEVIAITRDTRKDDV